MEEEPKKISFGFSKLITKKPTLLLGKKPDSTKNVQLIDCLEGHTIKVKDAVEIEEAKPLVIPLKDSTKSLLDRVKEAKRLKELGKTQQNVVKKEEIDERPDSELTLDELAARELIRDAQKLEEQEINTTKVHTLPIKTDKEEDKFVNDGKEIPTLDDYEEVPINDFGMAMLRGMGWNEDKNIGKNQNNSKDDKKSFVPELRPKGLGLGGDRMVKAAKPKPVIDKDGEELKLTKGGFAKIIAGAHVGKYCQVQGFDDEAGRVIAKTALKSEILTLNEFLIVPVTKDEYVKCSKVINNAKYNEFKEKEITKKEEQINEDVKIEIKSSDEEEEEIKKKEEEEKAKNGKHETSHSNSSKIKSSEKATKNTRNLDSEEKYERRDKSKRREYDDEEDYEDKNYGKSRHSNSKRNEKNYSSKSSSSSTNRRRDYSSEDEYGRTRSRRNDEYSNKNKSCESNDRSNNRKRSSSVSSLSEEEEYSKSKHKKSRRQRSRSPRSKHYSIKKQTRDSSESNSEKDTKHKNKSKKSHKKKSKKHRRRRSRSSSSS